MNTVKKAYLITFLTLTFILTTTSVLAVEDVNRPRKTAEEIAAYKAANKKTPEEIAAYKEAARKMKEEMGLIEKAKLTGRAMKLTQIPERATREAQIREVKTKNVRALFDRLALRFGAAVSRLEKLTERIEARIAAIKKEDPTKDLTQIEADVASAKAKLEDAKGKLQAIEELVDQALDSEDPKASFDVIKTKIMEVKSDLVEIHRLLAHAIGNIIGLRVGNTDGGEGSVTPLLTPTVTMAQSPTPTQ